MMNSWVSIRQKAVGWLRQGVSPRRLALTLALGAAVGCMPVMGLTTALCAVLAVALKLNLPAIQTANYAVMPLQLILIVPFVRLGKWLAPWGPQQSGNLRALMHFSPASLAWNNLAWHNLAWQMTGFAGQALLAWAVVAVPAVVLLTAMLTLVFKRVPALAAASNQ
jgi:uncharacterized protein (DUF2062 family)